MMLEMQGVYLAWQVSRGLGISLVKAVLRVCAAIPKCGPWSIGMRLFKTIHVACEELHELSRRWSLDI